MFFKQIYKKRQKMQNKMKKKPKNQDSTMKNIKSATVTVSQINADRITQVIYIFYLC